MTADPGGSGRRRAAPTYRKYRFAVTGLSMTVSSFADIASLPCNWHVLFATSGRDGLYSSRTWYRIVIATALPPGASPHFVVVRQDQRSIALFPLQILEDDRTLRIYHALHLPASAAG